MSLYVIFKSRNEAGKQKEMELHIPFSDIPKPETEEIDFIQADGDELDQIRYMFTVGSVVTIPYTREVRVHRWYGDIAKTIYYNLK